MNKIILALGAALMLAAPARADPTYMLLVTYWGSRAASVTPGLTKQQCEAQKSAVTVVVTFSAAGASGNPTTTVDPNAASSAECLQSPP